MINVLFGSQCVPNRGPCTERFNTNTRSVSPLTGVKDSIAEVHNSGLQGLGPGYFLLLSVLLLQTLLIPTVRVIHCGHNQCPL